MKNIDHEGQDVILKDQAVHRLYAPSALFKSKWVMENSAPNHHAVYSILFSEL